MKISKLFHWLYASVLFLPLLVIPIFAINIINHTPESLSVIQYEGKNVNFNQKLDLPYRKATASGLTLTNEHQTINVDGVGTGNSYVDVFVGDSSSFFIANHIYYLKSSSNNVFFVVSSPYYDSSLSTNLWTCEYPNYMYIRVKDSLSYNNQNFYLSIFDLTQMFGSGNEPSIQQFNTWFPNDYYDFDSGSNYYISDYNSIVYNDTDIGSQFVYSLYHSVDKYFNFDNIFNFGDLYSWLNSTFFSGSAPLGFFIFWHYLIYWLLISLLWLLFDVLMYVPNLVHRWLDKAAIE